MTPSSHQKATPGSRSAGAQPLGSGNALSQLQPSQVRTLRDGFQILDRDCDGVVNRDDVADMLSQLGLPNSASEVSQFFPPSKPQTIALAAFLNTLAETLSQLSPGPELLSAFSAFDDDDSGQVDWAELRDALLNTAPEPGERSLTASEVDRVVNGFTGRRAFNRSIHAQLGAKKGDVFKYTDFVTSVVGSNGSADGRSDECV
ncbi:EF-hand-like domain protein [Moelleriella libera RCEF 2490]|uniref:EF-hand-like domain protein n=1 Tax=Moelleriella libera RCEF 2490 TaxID=1081109 RepID=A0A168BY31_9HYPO|nr:EF-hand-like domain protein [Moelleriella libera RCEF 2490]